MEKILLQAEPRSSGRHALRELRNADRVPAVVYGPSLSPQLVSVDKKALHAALVTIGTGLLSLQIGSQSPIQVLAREVQRHPVMHNALHVDFHAVSMTERIRLEVPIVIEGVAPVLKIADMVQVRNMDSVEIECLPGDIPGHLVADISKLHMADDSVLVRDLVAPAGIKVLSDPEQVVISVAISRAAAAEEAPAEEVAADEVEVVTKRKPKEEEEAEGKEKK